MTSSSFGVPTQYEVQEMKIGDEDVVGLFVSLSIYENIYTPLNAGFGSLNNFENTARVLVTKLLKLNLFVGISYRKYMKNDWF